MNGAQQNQESILDRAFPSPQAPEADTMQAIIENNYLKGVPPNSTYIDDPDALAKLRGHHTGNPLPAGDMIEAKVSLFEKTINIGARACQRFVRVSWYGLEALANNVGKIGDSRRG